MELEFDIEPATYAALLNHEHEIGQCAAPRVIEEVYRLLRGGAARRSFELLLETGVATTLAPELTAMFQGPPSFEGLSTSGHGAGGDTRDKRHLSGCAHIIPCMRIIEMQ